MQAKVLVVGSLNMDLIVRAPRLSRDSETFTRQSFITIPGGKGANQAVAAARLGTGVMVIGCLGDDACGDQLYRALQTEDIGCRGVERVAGESSGVALIVVDDSNQSAIVIIAGGNGHLSLAVLAHHEHLLEQAQMVVCQLESPLETVGHVLHWAHAPGKTVIPNPAPATHDVSADQLPPVGYLVPNETESELLCRLPVDSLENAGRAAERLREMGAGEVIVTLGVQGALLVGEGRAEHLPIAQIKALDTTAAGDTFVGDFAAALVRSLDEAAAVRFGQAAATISVTRLGAQTSIPSHEEVERALASEAWEGQCCYYRRIAPAALSALRSQVRTAPRLTHPLER